jgi:hypothetical protein
MEINKTPNSGKELFYYPTLSYCTDSRSCKIGIFYEGDYIKTNHDHFNELLKKKYLHRKQQFCGGGFSVELFEIRHEKLYQ